jgi:hypothetical protein
MPAPKKEDYRVTRGKALIAEKKRVAANPNKKVVLPSKENVKRVAGLALAVAGPGKVVKGAQLAAKAVKAGSEGRAVARGLKAAQGKSLAPKNYKPDTAGRVEVKRFAEPLKKNWGNKEGTQMAAETVSLGRKSYRIEGSPVNKGKPIIKVQPKSSAKAEPKSNVKVVKNVKSDAKELGMSKKEFQATANKSMSDMARRNKSGQSAKEVAALEKIRNKNVPKKPTIKITGK